MMKTVLRFGACAVVATAAIVAVQADHNDCLIECQQQFQEDKRACREGSTSGDAEARERLSACLDEAQTRDARRRCALLARGEERRREREKQRCDREAKERRDACRGSCRQSPVDP